MFSFFFVCFLNYQSLLFQQTSVVTHRIMDDDEEEVYDGDDYVPGGGKGV